MIGLARVLAMVGLGIEVTRRVERVGSENGWALYRPGPMRVRLIRR